jgi:hypothetical protein
MGSGPCIGGADQLVAGNAIANNRIVVATRKRISYLLRNKRIRIGWVTLNIGRYDR